MHHGGKKSEASFGLDLVSPSEIRHVSHVSEELHRSAHRGEPLKVEYQDIALTATTSTYEITSVSPTLIDNDDVVFVSFSTDHPQPWDWIGAYSPPDVDITTSSPIKFGNCSESSSSTNYLQSGAGVLNFNLTNVRQGVKFYYFTNGYYSPILVANSTQSQVVQFRNPNQPLRNRVLPSGDPDVFYMLWGSLNSTQPVLQWGTQPGVYTHTVAALSYTFTQSDLCGGAAVAQGWKDPGLIHRANITGIASLSLDNTNIVYRFGDNATGDFSEEVTFHVPPRAGLAPPTRPTTVAVLGDLGVGSTDSAFNTDVWDEPCPPAINTTRSLIPLAMRGALDAVFLTGDISYANGYQATWDFFLDMVSPVAGTTLFLTTVGNHESDWPDTASLPFLYGSASGGECSVASLSYLPMPSPASVSSPWWSYDVGLIHFVGMSSEHNYTVGSAQYLFLENDLRRVNRSLTPWVVFSGHRPFYVDSNSCCATYGDHDCSACFLGTDKSDMANLQANIEPLLHKYRVNLGFSGHYHDMERQAAVFQNKTVQHAVMKNIDGVPTAFHENPAATVWMVVGAGGNGPSLVSAQYEWSERYWDRTWGYALISAVNATYLQWQLVNSATNEVIDTMVITQDFSSWEEDSSQSGNGGGEGLLGLSQGAGIAVVVVIVLVGLALLSAAAFMLGVRREKCWRGEEEQKNLLSLNEKKEIDMTRSQSDNRV